MRTVKITDVTMAQLSKATDLSLSFKDKLELAKHLDKLGVSVIELEGISQPRVDSLRIKSIASAVKNSTIAVPVDISGEDISFIWDALKEAKSPRLQVSIPVSTVQMEYLYHKKPAAIMEAIKANVAACKALTGDVEFQALDATRSDEEFLYQAVAAAIEAGATTVTVCDAAGNMLPDEFGAFLDALKAAVPALDNVTLGVSYSNVLYMADACAIAAVRSGAGEIKAAAYPVDTVSLKNISTILASKGSAYDATCDIHTVELKRAIEQISWICASERSSTSPFDNGVKEAAEEFVLTAADDMDAVLAAAAKLGYELDEEDSKAVYESFKKIASKKEKVGSKELDAIIASAAMQVPATYVLDNYVIYAANSHSMKASAQIRLLKNGEELDSVSLGDGPIDAAFLAFEEVTGCHYELDDFQIRSVTEGREAMGEAVIRLRHNGKIFSGRGISTDVIGASIYAYINALNKIVYEGE